jgi:DNA-binding transcriptional LysR family regulator
MDLSSLEIFCEVAREQSVTRAAKRLSRVQSNVTARVKQLEEELKVQLFSRSGRGMTLTPSGETMLGYAQRLLALAHEAREAVSPGQTAGRLRIGAIESTAAAHLPALLSAYHSRWPRVDLQISIGTSHSLIDDVAGNHLDCAFVADQDYSQHSRPGTGLAALGLTATKAYTEEMLLVLPPNHPPAQQPHELRLTTLAAFPEGCTYRRVLMDWLSPMDASEHRNWQVMEMTSYNAILASVAAGSCFALCPRSMLELQCPPGYVRTQQIATIETYLIARSADRSDAYEALHQSVLTGRHVLAAAGDEQTAQFSQPESFR